MPANRTLPSRNAPNFFTNLGTVPVTDRRFSSTSRCGIVATNHYILRSRSWPPQHAVNRADICRQIRLNIAAPDTIILESTTAVPGNRAADPTAASVVVVAFWATLAPVYLLYLDESGDTGPLKSVDKDMQPALCISGLVVPESRLLALTHEWVSIKQQFFPKLCKTGAQRWDWHKTEIKGSEIRAAIRGNRRKQRHAFGFIDKCIDLIIAHDCSLVSRVWIKEPDKRFKGDAVYTFSVQALCSNFQHFLSARNQKGIVVADSRMPGPNSLVAHSVFTRRVCNAGDHYPNLIDIPLFGHSDNHAGLQIVDVVATSVITPICINYFFPRSFGSRHSHSKYEALAERYCEKLKSIHTTYIDPVTRRVQGGLVVSDQGGKRGAKHLYSRYSQTSPVAAINCTTPATPPASPPATPP